MMSQSTDYTGPMPTLGPTARIALRDGVVVIQDAAGRDIAVIDGLVGAVHVAVVDGAMDLVAWSGDVRVRGQ